MASIIKNQILKHLSKFTKNLSQDKINLSTFKGEGDLTNLELDEVILMELLDLPTWMKLSKAVCNKLSIKIQWTRLKSKPICIYLDEVVLEVETCDPPRPPNNPAHMASYRTVGKYGFIDRVIDGIYVHINSVSAKFISRKFHATLQLSRVKVHSVTPVWKSSDELGNTKIRDSDRGEILLFKEVDWQTTRIEATAVEGENSHEFVITPLRFIANQSKIRITIKKKLSDCSIVATRVMLLLDDLLWVLTDTQLKAAIHYITSLRDLMDKSRQQSKNLAAEKLHIQGQSSQYADHQQQQQQQSHRPRSNTNSSISNMFSKFDVLTTSYHVISSRIDLHLCDDSIPNSNNFPNHNNLIEGGAMQISFNKLSVDVYPFNPAGGERKTWHRYMDNQGSRNYWVQQLFAAFKKDVTKARETCKIISPSQSPAHTGGAQQKTEAATRTAPPRPTPPSPRPDGGQTRRSTKLLESCYVLKIEEFTIFQVTTADNKRSTPKKFLSSDKKQLHLPSDMSVIHAEYTDYFFPEGIDFPVPHPNLYVLLNPLCVNVDWLTMLWMNYFLLNLAQSLGNFEMEDASIPHVDIKVEAIMPRVIVPFDMKTDTIPERPEGIQLQISKISSTNTRVEESTTYNDLIGVLDSYEKANLFTSAQFPNENSKLTAIGPSFSSHAKGIDNPYLDKIAKSLVDGNVQDIVLGDKKEILKAKTLMKDASHDIWCVIVEQVWLEFLGSLSNKCRPSPFVDSVPVTLWLCKASPVVSPSKTDDKETAIPTSSSCDSDAMSSDGKFTEEDSDSDKASPERRNRKTRKLLKEFYTVDNSGKESETTDISVNDNQVEQSSITNKSEQQSHQQAHCDKIQASAKGSSCDPGDHVQYSACRVANFNLLAKIGPGRVRAQMTHFQYLMVMGLIDSFTKFQEQMNADVVHFIGDSSPPFTFSVPLIVPELEFAMICPYTAELPPFDSPTSPSGVSGHGNDLEEEVMKANDDDIHDQNICNYGNEKDGSEEATLTDDGRSSSPTLDCVYTISKSQSDSGIHSHLPTVNGTNGHIEQDMDKNSLTRNAMSSQALSSVESVTLSGQGMVSYSALASESGYSSTSSGSRPRNQQERGGKSGNKATEQMKKFTSKMSGLADKLKAKIDTKLEDDDSETMSIRTDLSDDDTDFEMLSLEDGDDSPIFQHGRLSDTASISTDTDAMDDFSSFFAESSSKGRELITVILFKLYHGEVSLQGDGSNVLARIQAKSLLTSQPGNMFYEEFQSKFVSQSGFLQAEEDSLNGNSYAVKMRFTGPSMDKEAPAGEGSKGFLQVKAQDCGLRFTLSSLTSLTSFVEDEIVGEALPMHVDVDNFTLILQIKANKPFSVKEDRLSAVGPSGAPPRVPEPVQLSIHQLTITRGGDGIFHLTGGGGDVLNQLAASHVNSSIPPTVDLSASGVLQKGDNSMEHISAQETEEVKRNLVTALQELQQAKQQKQLSEMKAVVADSKLAAASSEIQQLKQDKQELQDLIKEMNSKMESVENLQTENRSLREQMKKFAYSDMDELEDARDLQAENEMYIQENLKLIQKVSHLEDEVLSLNQEKTSLIDTMKLLQDELNVSERRRYNSSSDVK